MIDYDVNLLKRNIRKIMTEKNITQAALSEATGIAQAQISKNLSTENSNCFTVIQLVAISNFLGKSTDEILGLSTQESAGIKIDTASDLLKLLFAIEDSCDVLVDATDIYDPLVEYEEMPLSDIPKIKVGALYFNNEYLYDLFNEWKQISTTTKKINDCGKLLYGLWKEDKLGRTNERYTSWKFKDKSGRGSYMFALTLRRWKTMQPLEFQDDMTFNNALLRLSTEDLEALQYYINIDCDVPFPPQSDNDILTVKEALEYIERNDLIG